MHGTNLGLSLCNLSSKIIVSVSWEDNFLRHVTARDGVYARTEHAADNARPPFEPAQTASVKISTAFSPSPYFCFFSRLSQRQDSEQQLFRSPDRRFTASLTTPFCKLRYTRRQHCSKNSQRCPTTSARRPNSTGRSRSRNLTGAGLTPLTGTLLALARAQLIPRRGKSKKKDRR